VSLANLPDDVYDDIGRGVRSIARGYRATYDAAHPNGGPRGR
jgi:aspartate 4-decarboxylase